MSSGTLTQADLDKLQAYVDAGDRYDYWGFLEGRGDKYAQLALRTRRRSGRWVSQGRW